MTRDFTKFFIQYVKFAAIVIISLSFRTPLLAANLNTDIYEKETTEKTFTSTVKMVRQIQDVWEVVFDAKAGSYTITDELQPMMVQAQKNKTSVTVKYDDTTDHILSVTALPSAKKAD